MPVTDPGDVLWLAPPAPWAAALGPVVHVLEDPVEVEAHAREGRAALAVVAAAHVGDLADWLRRPRTRPPVLVLTDADAEADEVTALRAGADAVLPLDAPAEAAVRAIARARARHTAVHRDAELYRLMVESATDLLSVVDARGRYDYVSPSVEEYLGYRPEEIVGTGAFDLLHPEDAAAVASLFAETVGEEGAVRSVRFRVRTKDGRTRTMEGVGRAVLGADGAPYAIVSSRDVTEEEATGDQLRASEVRYRTVVGALPDVISRIRTDGLVLDFHVPAAFETDFPAEQLIGRRLQDVIPPELAERFETAVAQMQATGEGVSYDYAVEVGGETKHREVRLAPLGDDEMISMLRDVTSLREHEAALERSRSELRALATHLQEVREEERARLSREVHDVLGQQLTAIRLGVGWFGRHYADDAAAQARLDEVRQTIDETIRHVRQIAADLRPGVLDDFGLRSAVEWQTARFEERAGLPCTVAVEGDGTEPPADVATAAFRVMQEALTNVARHAHAEAVTVTLRLDPACVRVTVADDGRGIERGRTVGRRTLGLLGMRERARALGGTLDIRSEPGRGTVVECTFPFRPPDSPAEP